MLFKSSVTLCNAVLPSSGQRGEYMYTYIRSVIVKTRIAETTQCYFNFGKKTQIIPRHHSQSCLYTVCDQISKKQTNLKTNTKYLVCA